MTIHVIIILTKVSERGLRMLQASAYGDLKWNMPYHTLS